MATAFVPPGSVHLSNPTTLVMEVAVFGADVAGGAQVHLITVSGMDFLNDNLTQQAAKIGAAIRAATSQYANGSGGTGYTIPANQITAPGCGKL